MENLQHWEETVAASLRAFGQTIMNALPNVIGAIILLFVGWLIAKVVSYAIQKLLQSKSMQRVTERLNQLSILERSEISLDSVQIISRFVYWVILLLFFVAASETLGWTAVSRTLNDLINYLPALLSALVIALIGLYLAQTVRNFVRAALQSMQIGAAKIVSSLLFYVLAIIVVLTALEQAGIDTSIITANLTLIIGAAVGAFALSFAIASRHVLENILASFYSRRNFAVGDRIKLDDVEGEVARIDSVSVAIKTQNKEVVFPVRFLIDKRVEKLG
ncbi:mechanosensitive ion channel family protein [Tunicatimonas pelagia]|uniref:mechanosensitive ion channel family protein n=1 Tax=Tunicatimonas pelagia TaxID=931531 RepID=UPI002666BA4B|nr:mechanosensitive ion channel domain-containing protein [Tunicatimonas pelagia]WKN41766.1 mechanosensitive ion channel [Tunicatimonas pelagia]